MPPQLTLKERITEDMKAAMRARDSERLGTIRLLTAAIKQKEVDDRLELTDAQVLAIVDKMIKQRRDAADQFAAGGRQDLADKEKSEIEIIAVYLPTQADAEEIRVAVELAVQETSATGPQDMGKVMAILKASLAGRADMSVISAQVKQALAKP